MPLKFAYSVYFFIPLVFMNPIIFPMSFAYYSCEPSLLLIANHDSGYLGMAVQLYVATSSSGTLKINILTQKKCSQKLMAQLKSTPLLPIILYAQFELLKACRKHNTTTCKSTNFVQTD